MTNIDIKENSADTVLIHIGKCGGTTVRAELNKKEVRFKEKHLCQVRFNPSKQYIIVIRNPVSRFISAFNWRHKLVVRDKTQSNRFAGEKMRLEQYQTVSNLAENIYSQEGKLSLDFTKPDNYIHHIREDINFYIGQFLDECDSKNILAVITTEHLEADLRHYFDIQLESHLRKNAQNTYLSPAAIDNLVKYLQKDFECIDKLHSLKLLSERQYAALSSKHPA
jgi:hypothetical protein